VLSVDDASNSIDVQDISSPTIATSNWTLRTPGGDDMFRRQANSQFNAVTGVTQAGDGSLWAAWTEPRNVVDSHGNLVSNGTQLPQPHIGVAHLLTSSNGSTHSAQLDNQTEYYNPGFGIALPDLTTDSAGEVAFSAYWGGGKYYANHAVGFLSGGFEWLADGFGTSDSYQGADLVKGNPYGDYETVRREAPPYGNCMVAASVINTFTQAVIKLAPDRPIFQFPPVSYPIFTIFSRPGVKCPPSFRTLPIGPLPTRAQPPPEPQASTVTLGCSPAGRAGTPMRFTGTLAPLLGGQQITITASGAASTSFSVQTGADGSFSATFTPPVAGQYQFAAGWSGNGQYAASSSTPCGVAVAPIATTLTLSCPTSPTAGAPFAVPGTLAPAIRGAPITLTYTSSDANTPPVTHGVTTASTGGFSDTAPASPVGTLTIAARFPGDPVHAQSNQSCTVNVVPIIP
jgi:hypothetical protein